MLEPIAQSTRGSERNQPGVADGRSRGLISTEDVCMLFFLSFFSFLTNVMI